MVLLFNYIVKFSGWPLWTPIARPKIYYEDKSVQGRKIKGKAIVISNHTEVWDYASVMFLFPMRKLRCVVAELMYEKNHFLSFVLKALGTIRVDRNTNDFDFIGKCCSILDKNGVVELYPEAKIPSKDDTELLPFKPSVTYLALESGAPIIPVYTDGNYFTKKRNHIMIGKPIDVTELYDNNLSEKENITLITEQLREKINGLKNTLEKRSSEN